MVVRQVVKVEQKKNVQIINSQGKTITDDVVEDPSPPSEIHGNVDKTDEDDENEIINITKKMQKSSLEAGELSTTKALAPTTEEPPVILTDGPNLSSKARQIGLAVLATRRFLNLLRSGRSLSPSLPADRVVEVDA